MWCLLMKRLLEVLFVFACAVVGARILNKAQKNLDSGGSSVTSDFIESFVILLMNLVVFVAIRYVSRVVFPKESTDDLARFIEHFIVAFILITADAKLEQRVRRLILWKN